MTYTQAQYDAFVTFIRNVMGIDEDALPDDEPVIAYSLEIAVEIVNVYIKRVSAVIYEQALNNLAGDNLINYANDQEGSTFFADLRKSFGCNSFVGGVIQSSADEATSESLLVPEQMKELTFANLQTLKTPYGRRYLGIAQSYGPAIWGLT